jgi:heat-inducible transcriptional repressor
MSDLTSRQIQILKAIIEEYIEIAGPVGSDTLDKKYNLGISPATIRNEMVKLTEGGYLKQIHTSAGRTPTPLALKYYVHELMQPKSLSVADEVSVKEKIWDYRFKLDKLLREATKTLAGKTKMLALSTTSEGDIYYAGAANILEMPEFFDLALSRSVFGLLDRFDFWQNLFNKTLTPEDINILLGEELGEELLLPCGFIYVKFNAGSKINGTIGVIGSSRINYPYVIPTVKYFGNLINEMTKNW